MKNKSIIHNVQLLFKEYKNIFKHTPTLSLLLSSENTVWLWSDSWCEINIHGDVISMRTTSEAEIFGPQAQERNKNNTPRWNWTGDKEYDPACLLTLLQSSSEEWHAKQISLANHYTMCVCVCLFPDRGRKIKPTSLEEQIQCIKNTM